MSTRITSGELRRTRLRIGLSLLGLLVLLTACSRTPPGPIPSGALAVGGPQQLSTPTGSGDSGTAAGGGDAAPSNGAAPGQSGGGASGSVTSSGSQSSSGSTGPAPIASWQGVTPTTITVAFAYKLHNCADDNNSSDASQAVLAPKDGALIQTFVDYFNKYYALPGGRHLKLVGNDTSIGPPMVDEGGQFCPEKQKAAASYVLNQLKPFVTLGGDTIYNQTIAAARTVLDIENQESGPAWVTDQEEAAHAPFAWSAFGTDDMMVAYLADYMAKRIVATQYSGSAGQQPLSGPRVIGVALYTGGTDDDALLAATMQDFRRVGIRLDHIYRIAHDNATGSQQAVQLALQMRSDGINTVIWDFPGGGSPALALATAFDGANYHPDIMICFDGNPFFDQLYPADQWARAQGVFAPNILELRIDVNDYSNYVENSGADEAVWAQSPQYDGKGASNGAIGYGEWSLLGTLAIGLGQSPVNFTPASWAAGLVSTSAPTLRCPVEEVLGRDHPQYVHWNWTNAHPSGSAGYTTVYWVNKTSSFGTSGYFESFDGYYAYFGLNDLPDKPSDDTRNQAVPPTVQLPPLGLSPFKTCRSIGLQGTKYTTGLAG